MGTVMKASEFIKRIKDVATNHKTLYVMGCFGAPMTNTNKVRYCNNHDYNKKETRTKMINAATKDTFGFDCVNLIKGVLWGWVGDATKTYGGAKYKSNGVLDTNADGTIKLCADVSTDFSHLEPGEAVWCKGHIGVYIGDGLAVECTPAWKNCVQITAVKNMGTKAGYNARTWTKHGKLPYIEYDITDVPKKVTPSKTTPKVEATDSARSKDEAFKGTYMVTANGLHLRNGAGTNKKSLIVLPNGTKVKCYGFYTKTVSGTNWLLVQVTYNKVQYTGFCSAKYLKKK